MTDTLRDKLVTSSPRVDVCNDPFDEYLKFPAVNSGCLRAFDADDMGGCPAKAREYLFQGYGDDADDEEETETGALADGRLYHAYLLEPDAFFRTTVVLDDDLKAKLWREAQDAGSKSKGFSKQIKPFQSLKRRCEDEGKTLVDEGGLARYEAMKNAALRDRDIEGALRADAQTEISVYFGVPATADKDGPSVQCKARVDFLPTGTAPDYFIDVKTCRSAHPDTFARQVVNLGYDVQLAWYRYALGQVGLDRPRAGFLAQEKTRPYCAELYWMPDNWMRYGWQRAWTIFVKLRECLTSGRWPGYGGGELLPPAYLEDAIDAT